MGSMVSSTGDLTPQAITGATFKVVRRGYDQGEVREFLTRVANRIQELQGEIDTLEVRSRAALARLQAAEPAPESPLVDHAETISRTLLLAQRTADHTVAQARHDAEEMISQARDTARAEYAEAYHEAQSEVEALSARRDFLAGDVEELERFLDMQRARLSEVAERLMGFVAAPIEGLGIGARPVLSSADGGSRALGTGAAATIDGAGDDDADDADAVDVDPTQELEFELEPLEGYSSTGSPRGGGPSRELGSGVVETGEDTEQTSDLESRPAADHHSAPRDDITAQPALDLEVAPIAPADANAPAGRGLRFRDDP